MGDAVAKEPTMEDILSSIRRIIAEEGDGQGSDPKDVPSTSPAAAGNAGLDGGRTTDPESLQSDAGTSGAGSPDHGTAYGNETPMFMDPVSQETGTTEAHTADGRSVQAADAAAGSMAQIAEGLRNDEALATDDLVDSPVAETNMEDPIRAMPVSSGAAPSSPAAAAQPDGPAITEDQIDMPSQSVDLDAIIPDDGQVDSGIVSRDPVASSAAPAVRGMPDPASPDMSRPAEPATSTINMAEATRAPNPGPASEAEDGTDETGAFKGALMSPAADDAVSGSFDRLKRSVMDDLEAKTESILRPMLREWLDDNLPNLVERLVREEIERVARGD